MPNINIMDSINELASGINELNLSDSTDEDLSDCLSESESDGASSLPVRDQKIKNRLMLGEADFSFANAFVAKRKPRREVCEKIIATEKLAAEELRKTYGEQLFKHLKALKAAGVHFRADVDATQLHNHRLFRGNRYQSIHFNFPHDRSDYNERTLPKLLANFFASAKQLQKPGDRVQMALPRHEDMYRRKFYESYVYEIFKVASAAGYNLIQARPFSKAQYPGYEHKMTQSMNTHPIAEQAAEYIFEFTGLSQKYIANLRKPPEHPVGGRFFKALPKMNVTDIQESDTYKALPAVNMWPLR